jgi:hypothetical protein
MAAQDNLSLTQQLAAGNMPMFMTAPEIKQNFYPHGDEYDSHEEAHNVWDRKLRESKQTPYKDGRSRFNVFKTEGVKNPVKLRHDTAEIYNGHHRVASMEKIDPKRLMAVDYVEPKEY